MFVDGARVGEGRDAPARRSERVLRAALVGVFAAWLFHAAAVVPVFSSESLSPSRDFPLQPSRDREGAETLTPLSLCQADAQPLPHGRGSVFGGRGSDFGGRGSVFRGRGSVLEEPLEDTPEALSPKTSRTEAEEDRLTALAHFAAGRACQQRNEPARAIRHYQRALRWDRTARGVVWPIVALAEELKWRDVRDRYLLAAARLEPGEFDPADLMELVDLVSEDEELRLVTRRFEEAITARQNEKKSPVDIVLRWRLAEIYVAGEKYDKAADCAEAVLAALERPESHGLTQAKLETLFGTPHPPYWLFGEYFLLAGRLDEAEKTFAKAHRTKPDAARLRLQRARISLKRKDPQAALGHLETFFAERGSDQGATPYELLGEALQGLGKSNELLPRVERLMADRPGEAALARFAATQYAASGQLDKAAALYERLLGKDTPAAVYAGLLEVYRKRENLEGVLRVMGQAIDGSPALENLGQPIQAMVQDPAFLDKLFALAVQRLAKSPASLGSHAPLAVALLATEAKRHALANQFFELATRAAPAGTADVLLLWGGNLVAREEYAKAAEVFRRGVDGAAPETDKPVFGYYLASALELGGRTEEALAAARAAAALNKNSPLLASHEGWILYHAKRYDEARAAYERFLKRFDPNHTSFSVRQMVREGRLVLSNLEVERGNDQRAAELLEEVLDEFPDDVSAANDLGYLWANQGVHLERSLEMARRAVKAEPDNAAYRDTLGWALYRLGRFEEAAVELEKAAGELAEGEVLDHLGEVYMKLGKPEQAAKAWRQAIEAYRKDDDPKAAAAVEAKQKAARDEGSER